VAQFRVEFVLDQTSGKYLAELYNPDNHEELLVRTEALYPTQASAVLGLVQIFKDAILKFPPPGTPARKLQKKKSMKAKAKKRRTSKKAKRSSTR
jgi:hypothetical protein